jgi:hypothetical protein
VRGPRLGALRAHLPAADPRAWRPRTPPDDEAGNFPPPPPGFDGSVAEWAIFWAHGALGRGIEGVSWGYQPQFAGNWAIIGFVPDFVEYDLRVSIDISDPMDGGLAQARGVQALRELIMRGQGYTHVRADDERALLNPIGTLQRLLGGVSDSVAE